MNRQLRRAVPHAFGHVIESAAFHFDDGFGALRTESGIFWLIRNEIISLSRLEVPKSQRPIR